MKAPEPAEPTLSGSNRLPLPGSKGPRPFSAPEDILIERGLGRRERLRLLDDWKLELELFAKATVETTPNCAPPTARVQPEELLRRVNACRRILNEQEH